MHKFQKHIFRALFIIPAIFSMFILGIPTANAATECTPEHSEWMDTCINQCQGDQPCIDSCCFDYPECCVEETCPPEDQTFVDDCLATCEDDTDTCTNKCCSNYPDCICDVKEDACTAADQKILDTCTSQCQGDQACIDSCCFDWPDCECPQPQDACTAADQKILDTCTSQCQGDQACIDSCCYDWPDCECPQIEDSCTAADQKILDTCINQCQGDQACIDSCCYDWPDCECTEKQPSCVDMLLSCHATCTDVQCWKDCDAQYECSNCLSYITCLEDLCAPEDTACQTLCDEFYPECQQEQPPEDYDGCYQDCFSYYKESADILSCIENCQDKFPGDHEKPYQLKEPRCFVETNFFDYEDVPSEAWFWAPVNFLTRMEIPVGHGTGINKETFHSRIVRGYNRDDEDDSKLKPGMTKDIFLPFRDLNRFEASKIATLVSCYTIPDNQTDIQKPKIFSDLDANSNEYMERVIYRTAEVNLVGGYTDGTFKPFQPITRAEFLKMFLTVGEFDVLNQTYTSSGFSDVNDPNAWYYPYIAFAANNNIPIIGGYEDGTFKPNNPISRNEAMKIITNTMFALDWISK